MLSPSFEFWAVFSRAGQFMDCGGWDTAGDSNEHRRVGQFAIRGDWIPASKPEKSIGSGFSRSPKGLEQGRSKQLRRFAPVLKTLDSGCHRSGGGGASGDSKAASARRLICHPWHLDACFSSAHFLNSVFHKPQIQNVCAMDA